MDSIGSSEPPKHESLPVGSLIDERYTVAKLLGSGGMGCVYLVHDETQPGRMVALKLLHKELLENKELVQRFLREVQLMRRVDQKNVVQTFELSTNENCVYFTMEYVQGNPLDTLLQARGLKRRLIPKFIIQTCEALEAIHNADIVHRDLKPGNILVLKDGTIKITDFGVARPTVSNMTMHNEILGSVCYIAPEIWLGEQPKASVDIYSLGIILYEIVTGEVPFDGGSAHQLMRLHLDRAPLSPAECDPRVAPWLNKLVVRLLEKSPLDRPRDAREIIDYVKLHTQSRTGNAADKLSSAAAGERSECEAFLDRMEKSSAEIAPPHPREGREPGGPAVLEAPMPHTSAPHSPTGRDIKRRTRAGLIQDAVNRAATAVTLLVVAVGLLYALRTAADTLLPELLVQPELVLRASPAAVADQYRLSRVLPLGALHVLLAMAGFCIPLLAVPVFCGAWRWAKRTALLGAAFYLTAGAVLTCCHLLVLLPFGAPNGLSLVSAAQASQQQLTALALLQPISVHFEYIISGSGLLVTGAESIATAADPLLLCLSGLYIGLFMHVIENSLTVRRRYRGRFHLLFGTALLLLLLWVADFDVSFVPAGGDLLFLRGILPPGGFLALWTVVYGATCVLAAVERAQG